MEDGKKPGVSPLPKAPLTNDNLPLDLKEGFGIFAVLRVKPNGFHQTLFKVLNGGDSEVLQVGLDQSNSLSFRCGNAELRIEHEDTVAHLDKPMVLDFSAHLVGRTLKFDLCLNSEELRASTKRNFVGHTRGRTLVVGDAADLSLETYGVFSASIEPEKRREMQLGWLDRFR